MSINSSLVENHPPEPVKAGYWPNPENLPAKDYVLPASITPIQISLDLENEPARQELTMLSFGAGQDSTCILYKLLFDPAWRNQYAPNRLIVVFSDTSNEHPESYSHLKKVQALCAAHSVEFVWIVPEMGFHRGNWTSLVDFYQKKNTIGSKAFPKVCSVRLKQDVIYAFLEAWLQKEYQLPCERKKRAYYRFTSKYGRIRVLLGIAKGEEKRVEKKVTQPAWMKECIQREYPLIDYGIDRKGCQDYISSLGMEVPIPSNCMMCHFKNKIEILLTARKYPETFRLWVHLERKKIEAWKDKLEEKKNFGVFGTKLLPEILVEAEKEYGSWSTARLQEYAMSHGHCVSTTY